jgi:hypothetical protein
MTIGCVRAQDFLGPLRVLSDHVAQFMYPNRRAKGAKWCCRIGCVGQHASGSSTT